MTLDHHIIVDGIHLILELSVCFFLLSVPPPIKGRRKITSRETFLSFCVFQGGLRSIVSVTRAINYR